jgi:hypothetical protein
VRDADRTADPAVRVQNGEHARRYGDSTAPNPKTELNPATARRRSAPPFLTLGVAGAMGSSGDRLGGPARSGATATGAARHERKPATGTLAERVAWSQMARGRKGPRATWTRVWPACAVSSREADPADRR